MINDDWQKLGIRRSELTEHCYENSEVCDHVTKRFRKAKK